MIGKGFSGVDTPLFDVSAEPTPPSPTPATPPLSPTKELILSPPQAESAQPSSPPQQQPSQTADISMTLLNTLMETCATLTKQVANLEQDKIAQAIKITKLKQSVSRLEKKRQFKSSGLKRLKKVGTAQRVESSADTRMLILKFQWMLMFKGGWQSLKQRDSYYCCYYYYCCSQVPKASAPRKKKGVVIQDPEETATASVIVHSEVKFKDKGNEILIEEPKPLKRQAQIEQDEAFARQLEAELNANINWNDVQWELGTGVVFLDQNC
nr:hypothetical protein [Tanacetum cinerariifolium]